MEHKSLFTNLTQLITLDKKLSFTLLSYISILMIFINLNLTSTPIIGVPATIIYFLINSTFIGTALFQNENLLVKLLLGALLLIVILGLTGLAVMILYNLDNLRSAIVLGITTFIASVLNKGMKSKNAAK